MAMATARHPDTNAVERGMTERITEGPALAESPSRPLCMDWLTSPRGPEQGSQDKGPPRGKGTSSAGPNADSSCHHVFETEQQPCQLSEPTV